MPIIVERRPEYQLPEEGLHNFVISDVVDEGVKADPYNPGRTRHRAKIVLDISAKTGVIQQFDFVTVSLHPKAKLVKLVKAAFGSLPAVGEKLDLLALVGRRGRCQIEHYDAQDGQRRSKVEAYFAPVKSGPITDDDLPEGM